MANEHLKTGFDMLRTLATTGPDTLDDVIEDGRNFVEGVRNTRRGHDRVAGGVARVLAGRMIREHTRQIKIK